MGELPVAYIRKYRILILADVHIGFEEDVSLRGGYLPRFQLKNALRILEEAFSSVSVESVVFAGDIKHLFNTLGRLEKTELLELLTYVRKHVNNIVVVRGNHDNFLSIMKRWVDFELVDKYMVTPYIVIHGHRDLGEELGSQSWEYMIMGHEHPSIALRDPVGIVGKFSCFLVGDMAMANRKVIVLPAVGAYQTGSKVSLSRETYLSPILKEYVHIETLKPIVVGSDIGLVEFPALKNLYDLIV